MTQEIKKATTYERQMEKLKERGCVIQDESFCCSKLAEINYYRLTAYFLPFKDENDTYREGTNFYQVYRIYEFDRKLRSILFTSLEEIEVYLRSQFSYYHAHKYGPTGYLLKENYSIRHNHEKFQENLAREIESNKKVPFVKHHIDVYGGVFPIWAVSELFTFGMLSYFYGDMKTQDKKALASYLYSTTPKNLVSWLRCCTDLRNICAHYGRLYYRVFSAIPASMNVPDAAKRRLWGAVFAVRALYPNADKWNSEILPAIQALFEEYQEDINLYHLAFPIDWAEKLKKVATVGIDETAAI